MANPDHLPPDDLTGWLEHHADWIDHMAQMHAHFLGWRDELGLAALPHRWRFFAPENIAPELDRMRAAGVTIAQPIAERPDGVKSFFVTGPDNVSIEIVEAKPIPDGLWR